NLLLQAEHVALAVATWKPELYEPTNYLEITCHWISDDFQLHEIFLDIIPISEYPNGISKYIKGIMNKWKLDKKINSITRDSDSEADEEIKDVARVDDVFFYTDPMDLDIYIAIEDFQERFRQFTEKEEEIITERQDQINIGIKNSQRLITHLITHEREFLKEALADDRDHTINELVEFINHEQLFTLCALEYIVILENQIRKWIAAMSDNLETISKGKWINNLLPDPISSLRKDAYAEIEIEYQELREKRASQNGSASFGSVTSSEHQGTDEFERYNVLTLFDQSEHTDPIEWWRQHKNELPVMSKLAQKYLAIPMTCHPSDRSYSGYREDMKKLVNDFKDFSVARKIIFLKHNVKYLEKLDSDN
ncbi:14781_t:CDS:2, partial [Acaulospora colombiana]